MNLRRARCGDDQRASQRLGRPSGGLDARDLADAPDPGDVELAHMLATSGLARDERGALVAPGVSFRVPDFPDLTYRESQRNIWHLDDHPRVRVEIDDQGVPHISHDHQVRMLEHGMVLSRVVRGLARALPDRPPTCCITATNTTNGTFPFHQLRPGEQWILDDLDVYLDEMIIVIEDRPPPDR